MEISVFKKTSDNFYGNYLITYPRSVDLVKVNFHGNITPFYDYATYRVSVWGNDDCGYEFDTHDEKTALNKFMEIIGLDDVKKEKLSELGLNYA